MSKLFPTRLINGGNRHQIYDQNADCNFFVSNFSPSIFPCFAGATSHTISVTFFAAAFAAAAAAITVFEDSVAAAAVFLAAIAAAWAATAAATARFLVTILTLSTSLATTSRTLSTSFLIAVVSSCVCERDKKTETMRSQECSEKMAFFFFWLFDEERKEAGERGREKDERTGPECLV